MKILIAHNFYQQPGGEDTVFHQESALLREAGHDVVTFTRSNVEIASYGRLQKVMLIPRTIWSSQTQSDFGTFLDSERPELVHFHNTFMLMSPSVYAACKDRGIPVVQTLHNYRLCCPGGAFFRDGAPCEDCATKGLWSSVKHKCYRDSRVGTATVASMLALHRLANTWRDQVDCYIALTDFCRSKMVSSGIPLDKIYVKPNFVTPDPGLRTHAADYALFAGRMVPEKGIGTLIKAWGMLTHPFTLRAVGDGPLRQSLQADCLRNHVHGVQFLGQRPRVEVIELLRSARFLVFPSQSYENFPMAIVEALACGVPVITPDLGSMREIVRDGICGLTFKPGDAEDLRRCITWAIEHPREMEELGRRARTEFEQKYTPEQNYKQLMNIYAHALGSPIANAVGVTEAA